MKATSPAAIRTVTIDTPQVMIGRCFSRKRNITAISSVTE